MEDRNSNEAQQSMRAVNLNLILVVLKNGGTWDLNANIFCLKEPSFEKMIAGFLRVVGPKLYEDQYESEADRHTTKFLVTSGCTFANFPTALYATDTTFQQGNRPSGNTAKGKTYFSGKHKLYGYKVEVSVSPLRLAIDCTNYIFRANIAFHQQQRTKHGDDDENIHDDGPLNEKYPIEWAILADKGYQGLAHHMIVIHPKKADPREHHSFEDERFNCRIATDRIIVENWFGRQCTLWCICSEKYQRGEGLYDLVFKTCASLNNYHARRNPLREGDGEHYNQVQNRLLHIGDTVAVKRRPSQDMHRARKRIRQELTIDDLSGRN